MSDILDRFVLPETAAQVTELRAQLDAMKNHRVFGMVKTIDDLQTFMSLHVYAVWDFMTLAKRLQCEYTGIKFPWVPPRLPKVARLINEIILAEESDDNGEGGTCSHFELYAMAMQEIGDIDMESLEAFVTNLRYGIPPVESANRALIKADPEFRATVTNYIGDTTAVARTGLPEEVLAYFVFGREDSIPAMFSNLLEQMGDLAAKATTFTYYLKRHIQLDGEDHSVKAAEMLSLELEGNPIRTRTALIAGINAAKSRIALWDAIAAKLEATQAATATA
ncbi:hypothetical protein [Ralstonia phage RP31]|uniref:DUF3050 domain-containing protein n=2 Tax=Ripduovirus RP12 TaxID=2560700 RepID=A0A1L7N1A4_9CAUD|nr:hypothetical protein FDH28_gp080 [Ralstonia phage RP12]BAW19054.1 hypothetical protein [Ralstonia phage RP12]BAW19339.1 hypothetical protein [Ralstonia phage RP31]